MTGPAHILVVGDVMLDRYLHGEVRRISPEAPVPVLRFLREEARPGGAANVAANVAAMGGRCTLLGVVGADAAGEAVAGLVRGHGAATDLVVDPGCVTTEKTRLVGGTQQIVRFDRDAEVTDAAREALLARYRAALPGAGLVILSDYAKGALRDMRALIAAAAEAGVRTLVDPKQAEPRDYAGAFLLKPNHREFEQLFGGGADIPGRARAALSAHRIAHMVVTLGADGMLLVSGDGTVQHMPTEAQEVFDVSGAGDTVIAALAVALGRGEGVPEAVRAANLAASIAVSHAGTYVVTAADMAARQAGDAAAKVLPLDRLLPRLAAARRQGRRIVFTHGCFDMLDPGLVRGLAAARRLGDLLVVGLLEDAPAGRAAGFAPPVNRFSDRAEVLAALAAVDFVVGFGEDMPARLIGAVAPDVLAGSDEDGGEGLSLPRSVAGVAVARARTGRPAPDAAWTGHPSARVAEASLGTRTAAG